MDRNGKFNNGFNGLGEGYDGRDESEIELAFQVHGSEPGDLSLISPIVELHAGEVSRLAEALLTLTSYPLSPELATQTVVVRTIGYAIHHTDRFHGESSLRNWLFNITIQQVGEYLRENTRRGGYGPFYKTVEAEEKWRRFDSLAEKLVVTLILRYTLGLEVEDIQEALGIGQKDVQTRLISGRGKLIIESFTCHRAEDIEAYLDGVLVSDPVSRDEVERHLQECEECSTFLVELRELDEQLRKDLQERWPLPRLTSQELEKLAQDIQEYLPGKQSWQLKPTHMRQIIWMLGLLCIFGVAAFFMIVKQPMEPEFTPHWTSTPTSQPVLEAIQLPEDNAADTSQNSSRLNFSVFTYDMAGNGDLFAHVKTSYREEMNEMGFVSQQIDLYDRQGGAYLKVSSSEENIETYSWHNSPPAISSDGRYLVFSQTGKPGDDSADFCKLVDGTECSDIFIYDRQSGTIDQITRGLDGGGANGISLAASISADGRWVAFWSMASNLTEDDTEVCTAEEGRQYCLDIFVYDRQEKLFSRIPVGASLVTEYISPDRISISGDGSLLAFTVHADSLMGKELDIPHESQAFIYHRDEHLYEFVNIAAEDNNANGASSGPVLSADGRYVAFTSLASNLVEGDTNGSFDVFLLDQQTGKIERVSTNSFGEEGNGDSGVVMGGVGFYSIDLSEDGRFVTFFSEATNLGSPASCNTDEQSICNGIYLYDRQSGSSEVIRTMQDGHGFLYLNISDDGRWISYMDVYQGCSVYQSMCMETVLYDRQRGWMHQVTDEIFQGEGDEWKRGRSIEAMQEQIEVMAVSRNGKYLAVAYGNNQVGLWNFGAERWVRTLEVKSEGEITSLTFDPTGEWLAAGTVNGLVNIWQVSGRTLYELEDHPGRVHSVVFSPDGNDLFVGTPSEVWVWRREERKLVRSYKLKYTSTVNEIALSPSGNLLAVANNDNTVWLQLLPSGTLLRRLGGHDNVVARVAFSPDGSMLAARALSGEVDLWKIGWQGFGTVETEFISSLYGINWFGNLIFSPDGRYLASGSYYEGIMLWDIATEKLINLIKPEPSQGIIKSVVFTPDGSTVLAGSLGDLSTWNTSLIVANARYFRHYSMEDTSEIATGETPPVDDWPESLRWLGETGSHLNLYEADELLSFDLKVPTHLPEQVQFMEAQLLADGGAVLHYVIENPSEVIADLYFIEHSFTPNESLLPVGEWARIKEVSQAEFYAEYIAGDWRKGEVPSTENATTIERWIWDGTVPVQRLRWYHEGVSVAIYYRERTSDLPLGDVTSLESAYQVGEWQPAFGLDQEDLVQVALGVESLPSVIAGDIAYRSYQIQEGDTCFGIAGWFGITVTELIRLNEWLGDCSLIRTGDVIVVPQGIVRMNMDQADLDCDDEVERLQVATVLDTIGQLHVYGIYLQDMVNIGLYKDVWQITARYEDSDYLSYPQLVDFGDCRSLIALQLIKSGRPELRIYLWKEDRMMLVLEQGLEILAVDVTRETLKIREQVVDPAIGSCQPYDVTYKWNGEVFVEIERIVDQTGLPCQ